ncbi:pyrimidodiazepine synthase-like [Centruroides vittatus]|uniref:pyrimidodiazepine synthase-like n=1 Tax=Centruroides vittatus TaxID=120091 RepID=UPI00350FEBB6
MSGKCYEKGSSPPPSNKEIRLYGMRFCPFTKRVRLVLTAKDIPYDMISINLRSKPEWFLEKNLSGKVPLYDEGGKLLTDSVIICDYLDDAFPDKKLYPSDPYLKAKDKLMLEVFGKILGKISNVLHNELKEEEFPQFWSDIKEPLTQYESELSSRGSYFGGKTPGMLDYLVWPWFEIIPALYLIHPQLSKFPSESYPLLSKWIEDMTLNKSVKSVAVDPQTYAGFVETLLKGRPNFDYGL